VGATGPQSGRACARSGVVEGSVSALRVTAIKGLRLLDVCQVELSSEGVAGNRAFFLIDERGRMVNSKLLGELQALCAIYDARSRRLRLTLPGGEVIDGEVVLGESVTARFFSRQLRGRLVDGPFVSAISEHVGRSLRLVRPQASAVDRGRRGAVSLVSTASVRRLSEVAGAPVDPRRFRMLIQVDGLGAHAEDGLVGRRVRIGGALVRFGGHVGRCLVTTRNPDSGVVDLPTLELLSYRRELPTSEPLAFGVWGEVIEAGPVRVGDQLFAEASDR
jgi:uncharacterized protein YcbX